MSEKADQPSNSLPVTQLLEIDQVCARFEAAWKAGQTPRLEDYLAEQPELLLASLRRELEKIDAEYRQRAKTRPLPADKPQARVMGNYRLLKKLGEGGMGAVYKALHTKLDKLVAIKVPLPGVMTDPERIARFELEMKAIGKLEDPHIVRAMDAGQVGDRHFLVMEYVEGISLSDLVRRSDPLRIADACELVRQAALGLQSADEHGLVHRDIKPSNLIVNADGQVKVLDLGLATFKTDDREDDSSESGHVMGTPDYMAPEQAAGEAVDIRADIYSLGCTLYRLLTGEAPFSGPQYKTKLAKLAAHISAPVPPIGGRRKDVPPKLAAVLDRMLAKDRAARLATPRQVTRELEPYCAGADLAGLFARVDKTSSPSAKDTQQSRAVTHVERPTEGPKAEGGERKAEGLSRTQGEGSFDPYYQWLGIPPDKRPVNHYTLLGIALFESDPVIIQTAVERQTVHLRTFALGKRQALSQKLLNEVGAAKACLLDPAKKVVYDAQLQASQASPKVQPEEAPVATLLPTGVRGRIPPRALAIAGAAGAAAVVLLLSVIIIVRNRQGEEVARVTVPDGSAVAIADDGNMTVAVPPTPDEDLSPRREGDKKDPEEPDNRKETPDASPRPQAGEGPGVKAASPSIGPDGKWALPPGAPPPAIAPFDEKKAKEHQQNWAKYLKVPVEMTNSIGMKLVLIPPGEFEMGNSHTPDEEIAALRAYIRNPRQNPWKDEYPQHGVRITRPFFLGKYEVTIGQFRQFVTATGYKTEAENAGEGAKGFDGSKFVKNPEFGWQNTGFQQAEDHPVVNVSWNDAVAFCTWVSRKDKTVYRLPTEAEWEYACRAGTVTRFYSGDDLETIAGVGNVWNSAPETRWTSDSKDGYVFTSPVGRFKANSLGLHDMLGNVWEWCADWYDSDYYATSPRDDPTGPLAGLGHVNRGGSFSNPFPSARSAQRFANLSDFSGAAVGFRLVCEQPKPADQDEALSQSREHAEESRPVPSVAQPDLEGGAKKSEAAPQPTEAAAATARPGGDSSAFRNPNSELPLPPAAIAPFDAKKAKQHQSAWAKHLGVSVAMTNSIGMKLVLIPAGEFMMGSPDSEAERRSDEGPRHPVRITKPFYLGQYEVTQKEYKDVMGVNPTHFSPSGKGSKEVDRIKTDRFPVESVSWDDATEFCRRLGRKEGRTYRLPTEAEWEYTCRGGTTTPFSFGSVLNGREANCDGNTPYGTSAKGPYLERPTPVGTFRPNAFGVYDMHGNVREWCGDWCDSSYYAGSPREDPTGPSGGSDRVFRGGSWFASARRCRSALRGRFTPDYRGSALGFRVARVAAD